MKNQTQVSPSMVIGIGPFGQRILSQVSNLYFASNQARKRITQFVCLGDVEGDLVYDLTPLYQEDGETLAQIRFPNSETAGERQEFIESLVKSAERIRASMNVCFHEIRTHEDLLQIDLDQHLERAINLFIVADLTDPMSAAAVLPLAFLLQDITRYTHNSFVHMLLNVGIFPEKDDLDDKVEVSLYSALLAITQAFTDVSDKVLENLLDAMQIENKTPLSFPIYLFDYRKPNDNDVRDMRELETIVGNSLIGLMLGDIPTTIAGARPMGYIQAKGAFFSSMGASCLVYQPEPLIENCSILFAQRLLDDGFLASEYHDSGLLESTDQVLSRLGTLSEWYRQLLSGTVHSMVVLEGQIPEVVGNTSGLTLSPIDFEDIRRTSWVTEIKDYSENFRNVVLPKTKQDLGDKSVHFSEKTVEQLLKFFDEQIQDPLNYPQGPAVIKELLSALDGMIENFTVSIEQRRKELKPTIDDDVLAQDLKEIQRLLNKAEGLPHFWVFLPKFLRKPLGIAINLKWFLKSYFQLEWRKRRVFFQLKERNGALTELVVLDCIERGFSEIKEQINQFRGEINAFEEVLKETYPLLTQSIEHEADLDCNGMRWDDTFRVSAVDSVFTRWAYQKYQKPVRSLVVDLLTKQKIFEGWKTLSAADFKDILLQAGKKPFLQLRDLHLEQVLEIRLSLLREAANHPGDVKFDPVSPLLRSALPLMRPNFDALGGSEYSTSRHFLLAETKESPFVQPLVEGNHALRFCKVDDPYIMASVTIRDLMPLAAFSELIQYLLVAYNKLNENQKKRLQNVFVPIPKLEGEDLIEKTFVWSYGDPEETLEVSIPVNENRYTHARQESRLPQTDWGQYATAESPELNYISACFLNMFLQHPQWSAYDQTSVILGFVQQGIAYAFDKDTTPLEEWPRYPIETLMEKVGDCEDDAILAAAIMSRLGFQVALLILPGHCALGIAGVDHMPGTYINDPKSGRHFYYAESTASGWQIGSLPEKYKEKNISIVPIERFITK